MKILRYFWTNALWWGIPLLMMVLGLVAIALFTGGGETMPNIYQQP
ncbi:MAG: hypothetical protein QF473_31310 [Planctomycetota bacterium]|jgi:hypothetical protein|nr:hypothetical protein [Planctomycetota bacterium]MDP6359653.1 hypothetical protein [Planctomycetota bacterium]MDP6504350.1 hypothetical protein [Planctomycetota bacterium]MDP7249012.1 hypothetical protein [Planctomycetota bacterium]